MRSAIVPVVWMEKVHNSELKMIDLSIQNMVDHLEVVLTDSICSLSLHRQGCDDIVLSRIHGGSDSCI